MRFPRLSGAIAASVLIGAVQVGLAPVASASITTLPMSDDIFEMVVDGAHDHVFVSSGPGEDAVAVLDYSGALVATLTIPGASGMAIVGSTLFVAAADADEIVTVDTATLTTGTLSIGSFIHPESIAYVAGTLWFTIGACGSSVQQAHVDTDGQNLSTATTLDAATCPRYATSPADPNLLLMFDEGVSPTTLSEYDMSTGPPTLVTSAANPDGSGNGEDAVFGPAGASFFTASATQDAFAQVKTSDLTSIRAYTAQSAAAAVDVTASGGGRLAGGIDSPAGNSVWVYGIGTSTATNSFDLPGDDAVVPRGVAWSDDGASIFAVTHGSTPSSPVRFYVLDPQAFGSTLTLSATPDHPTVGDQITLTGTLTYDDGPLTGGETVGLTRTDATGTHTVGQAAVALDGSYQLHDKARVGGDATYEASFDGSDHHKASVASDTVTVNKLASHVSIRLSDQAVSFGHAVHITGHLGSGTQSRVLELFAKPDSGQQRLIRRAKVDRHGNLSASYTPSRDTTFIAHFDGDLKHRSAQDSAITRVRVILTAKLTKYVSTSGRYRIYRGGSYAHCEVHVSPNHAGFRIHATLQGYVGGHWKVFDTDSFPLNSKSSIEFVLYGTSNVNFRVKAALPTHTDHLGDASPWLYLRFK